MEDKVAKLSERAPEEARKLIKRVAFAVITAVAVLAARKLVDKLWERADAYFLATAWKGQPTNQAPDEHSELDWVPLHEAGRRPLTPTAGAAVARLAALLASGHQLHRPG